MADGDHDDDDEDGDDNDDDGDDEDDDGDEDGDDAMCGQRKADACGYIAFSSVGTSQTHWSAMTAPK